MRCICNNTICRNNVLLFCQLHFVYKETAMNNQNRPAIIDNETGFIIDEKTDDELANETSEELFDNPDNAQKTGNVIASFVDSYSRHKNELPVDVWLEQEFSKYNVWENDTERHETALAVIKTIQENNTAKADLYAHLDKGKSKKQRIVAC